MADVIYTEKSLKLLAGFADEDDRTISITDPKENLTWENIETLANLATPVLIGDKYGAAFTRFKSADYVDRRTVDFDLEESS